MTTPQLDPFQEEAIAFFDLAAGRAIYADPMGARKTGTTVSWVARQPAQQQVLIVAPKAVHGHWEREINRFDEFAGVWRGQGTPARRAAEIEHWDGPTDGFTNRYLITSYGALTKDVDKLVKTSATTVVFDEAHRLKGRRTQVALAANKVCKRVPHVMLLTGTPVMNHPAELWQYLHMLMPQAYPGFWQWAEEYFYVELKQFRGARQATKVIHGFRPGAEERLRAGLSGRMIQRDIAELFEGDAWVEEPEHVSVPVELTSAERKEYDRIVEHGWGKIGDEVIMTGSKLVANTRLQQITSDWGTLNAAADKGSKVEAAIELIQDLRERGPVVVFATYKETVRRVVEGLGWGAASWTGDTPGEDKEDILSGFGAPALDVVVGTLASLGEGVDGLQLHSSQIVMLDRHWVPALNDQAIGRLRRSGQSNRVTVWHLYAEDTIDASVVDACVRKQNFADSLAGRPVRDVLYGRTS